MKIRRKNTPRIKNLSLLQRDCDAGAIAAGVHSGRVGVWRRHVPANDDVVVLAGVCRHILRATPYTTATTVVRRQIPPRQMAAAFLLRLVSPSSIGTYLRLPYLFDKMRIAIQDDSSTFLRLESALPWAYQPNCLARQRSNR